LSASWHTDYRDTAYIYIGGLPFELSEGDIITIFSQYGEPTYVNLVRDKETGKSKGFAFLKYEDQRSTDLAVDNLGGTSIMGRTLKVDHTRYKKKDDEAEEGHDLKGIDEDAPEEHRDRNESSAKLDRPLLKEEKELAKMLQDDENEEDPMKAFLIEEKRKEVAAALARLDKEQISGTDRKKRHHRSHRTRDEDHVGGRKGSHRSRDDDDDRKESVRSKQPSDVENKGNRRRSHRSRDEDAREDKYRSERHRDRDGDIESRRRSRDRSPERHRDRTPDRKRDKERSSRYD
jgi:RNA-binding motif X-linked protein 2